MDFFNNPSPSITDESLMTSPPTITTIEQLNTLLNRHPYLRDRPSFPKHYWHAQCYLLLKHAQHTHTLPTTNAHQLAHRTNLSEATITHWLNDDRFPVLLRSLQIHEHARYTHEQHLPHEHHHYRIDPTTIYNAIRPLKDHPHTPENLTSAIETLYKTQEPKPFHIADLKPYHDAGPQWTRTIAHSIHQHKEEIETRLNQRTPLTDQPHTRIRIAIHDHTLYLYHHKTNPTDWLTRLKHEYFYFDTTDTKNYLIDRARRYLNTTDLGLSNIIQQVTDHPGQTQHPKSRLGDITRHQPYLIGETLNFLLDASDHNFKQILLFITRLGRDTHGFEIGGIHNPIFLEDEQRDLFKARMAAIALSDGHIHHEKKQFTYVEKDPERIEYVKNLIRNEIGDIYIAHEDRISADRLNMPVVFGRLLEQWGIPAGDKHLSSNFRLPEFIRNGNDQIKAAYLAEVIPEDGYFHTHHGPKFGIKRAQILDAGPKTEQYDFKSIISNECKHLIQTHGESRSQIIRDEPVREVKVLVWGSLENLTESENGKIREIAIQLKKIVQENPCQFLTDEKQLCESLGISMIERVKELQLHQSGRASVIREIHTRGVEDALLWADIAIPSSNPKQALVKRWFEKFTRI
ncbi:MAG: hypothetical protein ACFFDU_06275 [Candidatus Thorarchaeota archaeon]